MLFQIRLQANFFIVKTILPGTCPPARPVRRAFTESKFKMQYTFQRGFKGDFVLYIIYIQLKFSLRPHLTSSIAH